MLHDHLQVRVQRLGWLDFVVEAQNLVIYHVGDDQSLRLRHKEVEVVVWAREALPREADQAGHLGHVDLTLDSLLVLSQESYVLVDVLAQLGP